MFSGIEDEIVRENVKLCYNNIKQLAEDTKGFVYLDVMKSPIGKIKNKFRYQILARIKNDVSDEIIQKMYEICDSHEDKNVSVFVELDPQSLS